MVKLKEKDSEISDRYWYYINANFINVSFYDQLDIFQTGINADKGTKAIIAAMAPSTSTVEAFWKMILENNVTLIIQLCPEIEQNKVRNI